MKSSRILASAVLAAVAVLMLSGATASKAKAPAATREKDKLIILSTTDVKGKTSPCG